MTNEWQGNSPLCAMLKSFFNVVTNPGLLHEWPLSIHNCQEIIGLSVRAAQILEKLQMRCLKNRTPLLAGDVVTRNLLIDIFLPKTSAMGEHHSVLELNDQLIFSNYVINLLNMNLPTPTTQDVYELA